MKSNIWYPYDGFYEFAGQARGDGAPKGMGQGGLEVLVGDTPDAVSPEELAHEAEATVTVTVSGEMRTMVVPRGVRTVGMTSLSPTSRSPTGTSTVMSATSMRTGTCISRIGSRA